MRPTLLNWERPQAVLPLDKAGTLRALESCGAAARMELGTTDLNMPSHDFNMDGPAG